MLRPESLATEASRVSRADADGAGGTDASPTPFAFRRVAIESGQTYALKLTAAGAKAIAVDEPTASADILPTSLAWDAFGGDQTQPQVRQAARRLWSSTRAIPWRRTRARYLRAAGAVLNGFVRDTAGIEALGFPTFCRGVYAQDQGPRGKVIEFRTPVEIEGVRIAPGDLLFGDREGVLIVPAEVESEAVDAALAKTPTENKVATAIRGGMSAREAFETFGVL